MIYLVDKILKLSSVLISVAFEWNKNSEEMYTILTLAAIDTLIKSEKVDTFNIEKGLEMQQTPSKRPSKQ